MMARAAILFLPLFLLAGCETLGYYAQAVRGQLDLLTSARPVDDWLADPSTPPDLRERLQAARGIRQFASQSLALPDNGSYGSYVDLGRPFVVWNVFAAPRLSVESRKECFPVTGCVSYRGFFSEAAARGYAEGLRKQGYDVYVGGVPAYSTLGWFDDPLLSTFIRYPDTQLARLVFHELAHQRAYASGDTRFNESFAVVVEEEGVRRWLQSQGRASELTAFLTQQARKRQFATRVQETRERLDAIYNSGLPEGRALERKREEYAKLRADYPGIPQEANNAFLASVALYTGLVPEFERLLVVCEGDLPKFYDRVKALAEKARGEGLKTAECRPSS